MVPFFRSFFLLPSSLFPLTSSLFLLPSSFLLLAYSLLPKKSIPVLKKILFLPMKQNYKTNLIKLIFMKTRDNILSNYARQMFIYIHYIFVFLKIVSLPF